MWNKVFGAWHLLDPDVIERSTGERLTMCGRFVKYPQPEPVVPPGEMRCLLCKEKRAL